MGVILKDGTLVKLAKIIEKYKLVVSQHLGAIFLTIVTLWVGYWFPSELEAYNLLTLKTSLFWLQQYTPWVLLSAIIMSLYGGIGGALNSRKKDIKIKDLQSKVDKNKNLSNKFEEAQQAIDYLQVKQEKLVYDTNSDYLGFLSNDQLSYNDSERISLYLYNGNEFILAGRYSKNQEYSEISRSSFPDSEGCIGQTWKNGGKYFIELPTEDKAYYDFLKNNLSIDKCTVKRLRMKSHAYFSYALEEGYRRIGIVLFESLKHGILKEDDLAILALSNAGILIEMLKRSLSVSTLVAYQKGESNDV